MAAAGAAAAVALTVILLAAGVATHVAEEEEEDDEDDEEEEEEAHGSEDEVVMAVVVVVVVVAAAAVALLLLLSVLLLWLALDISLGLLRRDDDKDKASHEFLRVLVVVQIADSSLDIVEGESDEILEQCNNGDCKALSADLARFNDIGESSYRVP